MVNSGGVGPEVRRQGARTEASGGWLGTMCSSGWLHGLKAGWMAAWTESWLDGCMDRRLVGWRHGPKVGWMAMCTNGWMDRCG
eukprot:362064-Chlamydomonas_euryale.AAC.2